MKKEQIKAAVFDYDDTLYSHQKEEIPPLSLEALKELKKNGYILGLCTSRFPAEMTLISKEFLSLFDAQIQGTGALLKKGNEYLYRRTLAQDTAAEIISYLNKEDIPYLWITDTLEEHFAKDPGAQIRDHTMRWQGSVPTIQNWSGEALINICVYHTNEVQMQKIHSFNDVTKISQWGTSCEINAKGTDKAYGLQQFADAFHIDVKEIAAFGDGANDISMIDCAGIGIAVGSANEELQKHAVMVTDEIEEGGIYDACLRQGWIQNTKGIQILFFDIDGTTYQNNIHDLPVSAWHALRQLKKKGYRIVIDTSRAREEMSQLPKAYTDMMDAMIINAGGEIEMNGKMEYHYLPEEHVRKAVELMEKNGIVYRWVDDQDECCLNCDDPEINARFYRLYHMVPKVKKWDGQKLIHILYYTNDQMMIKAIDDAFSTETHTHFGYGHEQTSQGINKASAMKLVCAKYGLTLENAAAFGDGANDARMIKAAKIGVAMGNACDACKEAADYITDNIEDDGLYNACVQFGWISR
jgi:Cof subfamily protein (haloacid dehalogenase superfamily)